MKRRRGGRRTHTTSQHYKRHINELIQYAYERKWLACAQPQTFFLPFAVCYVSPFTEDSSFIQWTFWFVLATFIGRSRIYTHTAHSTAQCFHYAFIIPYYQRTKFSVHFALFFIAVFDSECNCHGG